MMTDKATVEMESPVAGKVLELAGEVGDQVPIGSVLAVIETEGADRAAEPVEDSHEERPLADGAVEATPEMAHEIPVTSSAPLPGREGPGVGAERSSAAGIEPAAAPPTPQSPPLRGGEARAQVLASPAVRARARDLGIDLAQVKTTSDRLRHSDLDAYLLYNGGSVGQRSAAPR